MANPNENRECHDAKCDYNFPYMRPHQHVLTNNGTYIKFIVEKPKLRSQDDANTG